MTAIVTTFHGPTNSRGARISARALATKQRASVPYPHDSRRGVDAHEVALKALLDKMQWDGDWQAGEASNGSFVWVNVAVYHASSQVSR